MTSFGSIGQVGQAIGVAQGEMKSLGSLAEKFKVALQQKEPRELGSILAEVKSLGVKAEKAFLAAAVKTEGNAVGGVATLKGTLANLSVEQRAELAKELFAIKGLKGHFLGKAHLESKLANYLAKMGQEKPAVEAPKDEMIRGGVATVFETGSAVVVAGQGEAPALPPGGGWGHSPDNLTAADLERMHAAALRFEHKTPEER